MNQIKLKTLEEIVADLRAKGELDEEALAKFEKWDKKLVKVLIFLYSSLVLATLPDFGFFSVIILIVAGYYFYFEIFFPSKASKILLLKIFSLGKITDGIITKYEEKQAIYWPRSFLIDVMFKYDENPYKNKQKIQGGINASLDEPLKQGMTIKIIYLKESPELCWIYTEKLNNIYNIRKK